MAESRGLSDAVVGIVLVNGAFHGPWCWDRVLPLIAGPDVVIATPNLYDADIPADPAVVQRAVGELGLQGPVIVCGHSFGGYPVSALNPQTVERMVYLCAFLPDVADWYPELPMFAEFMHFVSFGDDGVMHPHPERARGLLFNDRTDADATWATGQLRPHSMAGASGAGAAAFGCPPATPP